MTYYLDGNNICYWKDEDTFSLAPLLNLCLEIKNKGDNFICFFDANAIHLPKTNTEKAIIKNLLKDKTKFRLSPGGTSADDFIVMSADNANGSIISNDWYRNLIGSYPWLDKNASPKRLFKGNVYPENDGDLLLIPDLKINRFVETNLQKLVDEIKNQNETHPELVKKNLIEDPLYGEEKVSNNQINNNYTFAFWFDKGKNETKKVNYKEAIDCFTEALKLNPHSADAYYERGFLFYLSSVGFDRSQNLNEAIRDFKNAIELTTHDYALLYDSYALIGDSYEHLNKYDTAIPFFSKAIEFNQKINSNDRMLAYNSRGKCYMKLKDYHKAINDFTESIKFGYNDIDIYFVRAFCLYKAEFYLQAIDDFSKDLQLHQQSIKSYYYRGKALSCLGKKAKSIEDYNKAIKVYPKFSRDYNFRGLVYYELKQYDKAIVDYTEAIDLWPKYAEAYYNRGIVYNELKDYDKANADFTKAEEFKDDFFDQ
jgi:tetratricopeptide (TPR) repeat protein